MSEQRTEAEALEFAHQTLAASREGVLRINAEDSVPVKFTTSNADGRIVASVPVATFFASEIILFVPEEKEGSLSLLLSAEELEEGPETDRWMAFHTESDHVRWGIFYVDAAKHDGWVFDGDAMMRPNLLATAEPALVKKLNADKGLLVRLCQRFAGMVVPDPVCVGVDQGGLHVRARFGVVRVAFERTAKNAEDAGSLIDAMISKA